MKYYPFPLVVVSLLIRDYKISLVRFYWRYNRVSVCFFVVKLGGILFLEPLTVTKPDGGRKWLMAYAPIGAKGKQQQL